MEELGGLCLPADLPAQSGSHILGVLGVHHLATIPADLDHVGQDGGCVAQAEGHQGQQDGGSK